MNSVKWPAIVTDINLQTNFQKQIMHLNKISHIKILKWIWNTHFHNHLPLPAKNRAIRIFFSRVINFSEGNSNYWVVCVNWRLWIMFWIIWFQDYTSNVRLPKELVLLYYEKKTIRKWVVKDMAYKQKKKSYKGKIVTLIWKMLFN